MGEEKPEKKQKSKEVTRREFLKDAGLVVGGATLGSMAILGACTTEKTITQTQTNTITNTATATVTQPATTVTVEKQVLIEKLVSFPKSGYIQFNPDKCIGCSECLTLCACYHNSNVNPILSGIIWHDEKEAYNYSPRYPLFCQQCSNPECYLACPLKDQALCIDAATGARYINTDKCNGCGICVEACPFDVPRISINKLAPIATRKAYKCDLCHDRVKGPICIELCPMQALTLVSKEGRL